jgi:HSP20 family protein
MATTTMEAPKEVAKKERRRELAPYEPLVTLTPQGFVRRFSEEMDRVFEGLWGGRFTPGFLRFPEAPGPWMPHIEVKEKDGEFILRADLPGLTKDDISVEVTPDAIVLKGERRKEKEEKGEGFYRSEVSYGAFHREIPLTEGMKVEEAKATFKDGVLEVKMPAPAREAKKEARRLEIQKA